MNDLTFELVEDGKKTKYIIIKYFNYKNKNYIIYHEENNEDLFASSFEVKDNNLILNEVKTDEEWDYIDSVLEELDKDGKA